MRALVLLALAGCNLVTGGSGDEGFDFRPPPIPDEEGDPCDEATPDDVADCDGDGVVRASDCDDLDDTIGALLYSNSLDTDDGTLNPPAPLGDDWAASGQTTYATSGGQEAQLGPESPWADTVVIADVSARGTESGCATCADLYRLSDHPDGALADPDYGLRLDNLFEGLDGAVGGGTTFSFDTNDAMVWAQHDPNTNTIRIFGTIYGGEDTGSEYGFGEGHYQIHMVYNANVEGNPEDGWTTSIGEGELENHGWIRSLDNADTAGMEWPLYDYATVGPTFLLLPDGHRMPDGPGTWVGRSWLEHDPARDSHDATRDFLFLADPVNCSDRTYTAMAHEGGHAFWFVGFEDGGGDISSLDLTDGVFKVDSKAGTASLTGSSTVYSGPGTGDTYTVNLTWEYRGTGPEFGGPKIERAHLQPEWLSDTWEYYDLTFGELVSADGERVVLTQRPVDGSFPFQVGDSANNKDAAYGGSTWFDFTRYDAHGVLIADGYGDLNATFESAAPECVGRWRAGVLSRARLDDTPDEGFVGYRCALARNSEADCFAEGHFLQIAAFLDAEEDALSSECGETCENPTFDQLARVDHPGAIDISVGDLAEMRFYTVGGDLYCSVEDADGNRVVASASDHHFGEGTTGLSTLNMYGDYDDLKVCEALALPE